MSYFVRLSVFLLISIGLHLLVLQFEISRHVEVSQQQGAHHGVGFVVRPSKQFLQLAMSPAVPEPRTSSRQQQPVEPKPKTEPLKPAIEPKKVVVSQKNESEKVKVSKPKPAEPLTEPGRAKAPVAEVVREAEKAPVVDEKNLPEKIVTIGPEVAESKTLAMQSPTDTSVLSASDGLAAAASVAKEHGQSQKTFAQASPRYDLNPEPAYPESAQRRGQEGTVRLDVLVLANGKVGEVTLEHSSGYHKLDRAAIRAVRFWLFKPAMSLAGPIESRVIVPVDFVLSQ